LPGTLVIAVVFVTVYSGVNLNSDLSTGAFDRYRSLPIWRAAPIAGGLVGDCARYVLAAVLVVLLGLVMGFDPAGGLLGTVAAIALVVAFSLALSLAWVIVGLLARTPRAVMTLGFMILFPVTFVSNVFVDPATMPALLRSVADANPVSHLVTAARGLMEGTATTGQVVWVLIATAALALVLMPLAARLYRTRDARPR
jgi:ABC-2 type transport system permease protein